MTQRFGTIVSVVASALLLALLAGVGALLYTRPVAAQSSAGVPGMRQVSVLGHGEVKARPDTATVQIGVETDAATAKEALAQNSAQAQALQQKLAALGVAEQDLQTSNFSIAPVYGSDGRQVTGYRVSNSVTVTIRKLDTAGTLLDQVVQAGANSIYGISFSVADQAKLMEQARQQAVADAKARAGQLASAGGAAVGDVLVISENVSTPPIPMPMMDRAAEQAPNVPVQPGAQTISVDVQATFALR
ncbi:MAG TPA: SIMPL domain-containing protein [Kouleothrix sp.]|uniref:SIMPL domain-containing protein n=1 Tax=Kouleothrix sp. TaxID=2779161 RepID=UPI002B80EE99|nr:SIMPL domain-containing protein [Kouleothrix sp.]HRC74557.1 SIMPL domain-containing protein [Kouleothrix sp.]